MEPPSNLQLDIGHLQGGYGRSGSSQRPRRAIPSIRHTERLGEAGIQPSVGRIGDSYDCEDWSNPTAT